MSLQTRICKNYANGDCRYGSSCQFAHGAADLRRLPEKKAASNDWEEEEDWGETAATPAYNPMKKIEEAKGGILYNPMNSQR